MSPPGLDSVLPPPQGRYPLGIALPPLLPIWSLIISLKGDFLLLAASQTRSSWTAPGFLGTSMPSSSWLTWIPQNSMASQQASTQGFHSQKTNTGYPGAVHTLLIGPPQGQSGNQLCGLILAPVPGRPDHLPLFARFVAGHVGSEVGTSMLLSEEVRKILAFGIRQGRA